MAAGKKVALGTLAVLLGVAVSSAFAGIKSTGNQNNNTNGVPNGPYGLPGVKRVVDACKLIAAEEQVVVQVYNYYKKQEQKEKQNKSASTGDGRADCIAAIKKGITPEHAKAFEDYLKDLEDSNKKKKK
jgi:hypothetical protein